MRQIGVSLGSRSERYRLTLRVGAPSLCNQYDMKKLHHSLFVLLLMTAPALAYDDVVEPMDREASDAAFELELQQYLVLNFETGTGRRGPSGISGE